MNLYNLPLQNKFTTNQENHYDFENDHPTELLLGYIWEKRGYNPPECNNFPWQKGQRG